MNGDDIMQVRRGAEHQCICCGGIIEVSPDCDLSVGLDLAIGLVSDECALICDGCTSSLIAAAQASKPEGKRRR